LVDLSGCFRPENLEKTEFPAPQVAASPSVCAYRGRRFDLSTATSQNLQTFFSSLWKLDFGVDFRAFGASFRARPNFPRQRQGSGPIPAILQSSWSKMRGQRLASFAWLRLLDLVCLTWFVRDLVCVAWFAWRRLVY
jgi:hypothetical protein